jgi:hypothetical protein
MYFSYSKKSIVYFYRYRHELFDNGFGIEWISENDDESRKIITEESINEQESINNHHENNSKHTRSIITVRSINNNATRLPAHIWRSLAKVSVILSLIKINEII